MSGISFEKLVGLSQDEVVERQERDGFNELPTHEKRTAVHVCVSWASKNHKFTSQ
jgi:hypothetical protein